MVCHPCFDTGCDNWPDTGIALRCTLALCGFYSETSFRYRA